MPFTVFSEPPPDTTTPPMSGDKAVPQTPLRPVLATSGPGPSRTSSSAKRIPLGEKRVSPPPQAQKDAVAAVEEEERPRFPTATVDVESIGSVMASRLVTCVLGFVLFLKSQIPFPVVQLIRMHSRKSDDDASYKKLDALITSFDVLSSHLSSTFTALAVAFARSKSYTNPKTDLVKAHLAIILGPSPTSMAAARARVMLELDGLLVSRASVPETAKVRTSVVPNEYLKENAYAGVSRTGQSFGSCEPLQERRGPASQPIPPVEDSDSEDGERTFTDSEDGDPPSSDTESNSEGGLPEDHDSSVASEGTEGDIGLAERNLSRTLTMANSDPELGMAADIRPTFTHIFLRAPRKFSHPSWIPRQGVSRDLDPLLCDFEEVEASASLKTRTRNKGQAGIKTDYLRVQVISSVNAGSGTGESEHRGRDEDDGEDGEDEMIWWSWDGRLEGFTEI